MKPLYFILVLVVILFLSSCAFISHKGLIDKINQAKEETETTEPELCGGVTDRSDDDAPKVIISKDITSFDTYFVYADESGSYSHYEFNAKQQADGSVELTEGYGEWASKVTVGPEFLISLQEIIDKHKLASLNGVYRVTSGLPFEYGPCSLLCKYESGESISFSEDGNPHSEWMGDITELFLAEFPADDETDD
ncbi:MAG TPA: hypothetical protein GXZ76_08500 [Clostridiaceae bacterium]|jgi:hypothetical protein|nr:hypothetical protein [Clostridiaceae bacterium]